MRRILGVFSVAAVLALPAAAQAQMDGGGGGDYGAEASHIEPSRAGPRPPKPLARAKLDEAVAKIFAQADTNRDGILTLAEFNANIAARKAAAIRDHFAAIDTDRNQSLSFAEFSAWQLSLGSVALSDRAGAEAPILEELPVQLGKDREDIVFEHLIRPISATVIVEANTDYDAGASLAEIIAYEHKDFDAGDINKDGWLTYDEVNLLEEAWGERDAAGPGPGGAPGGGFGGGRGRPGGGGHHEGGRPPG